MARRNHHSQEEIRMMVLSAAEAIVIEQGGAALTVRKIAVRIGYTVGSVYMVFDNMADVVSHINARTIILLTQHLQKTQITDLSVLGRAYLFFAVQNYQRWQLWSETQVSEGQGACDSYQNAMYNLIEFIETQLTNSDDRLRHCLSLTLLASIQGICVALLPNSIDNTEPVVNCLDVLLKKF